MLEIAAHLNTISSTLQQEMAEGLEEFGLRIVNFFVNSITTPEDDPAVMRLKGALAKRAEMDILGFTYQQERSFDTMERAAGNEGAGIAPLMGAGIGLGLGTAMGVPMGSAMAGVASQVQVAARPPAAPPPIASPTPPPQASGTGPACPKCGTASPPGARFCHGCGQALARGCVSCSAPLQDGARFCSSCGTAQP